MGRPKFLLVIAKRRKQKGKTFLFIKQTLLEFAGYWEAQCLLCTLGQSKSADNWILIYGKNIKKWKRQEKNLTVSIPFVGIALVITANQRLCHSWAAIWYNIIEELSFRINTAVDQGLQARTMDKFLNFIWPDLRQKKGFASHHHGQYASKHFLIQANYSTLGAKSNTELNNNIKHTIEPNLAINYCAF